MNNTSFLNRELLLSIVQIAQLEANTFEQYKKMGYDVETSFRLTGIQMKYLASLNKKAEDSE